MSAIGDEIKKDYNNDDEYKFLKQAKAWQLKDLKIEKEDSFMSTTEPQARINQCLAHFGGIFTKNTLREYYHEAAFILEQDFSCIENSICLFEVIHLAIAL